MLDGKQRRYLRSLGHHLQPIVHMGKDAVSPAVVKATEKALQDHELIKVKLLEGAGDRHESASALAEHCKAELAGVLGRTALIYRARKKDPKIKLPRTTD